MMCDIIQYIILFLLIDLQFKSEHILYLGLSSTHGQGLYKTLSSAVFAPSVCPVC